MRKSLALSAEDLGQLLFKASHQPRVVSKFFLRERGGVGSQEELETLLSRARNCSEAVSIANRLERESEPAAPWVDMTIEGRVAEMLADILVRMREQNLTQKDVAERCGWSQPQVAAYLTGRKEPGIRNLTKLANAVGRVWRLTPAS